MICPIPLLLDRMKCVGMTTQAHPSTGGVWESSDETVALIDNMGVVTGLNVGTASFRFTDVSTGCTSDGSLISSVISPVSVGGQWTY